MIIVDTSAWICLFERPSSTSHHQAAKRFHIANKDPLAVSDLIIEETHKWLIHHAFPPSNALQILEGFVTQKFAQIISIEENDRQEAKKLVEKYLDQKLSYTDAVTLAMMKRLKIKKVFSFDRHFDLFRGVERVPS
ncbi:MAG: PIN domain-containing protein [Parachlamydia sp.]|nr:PIN domain-containing protein [Parachlamydia sp.]